MMFDPVDDVPEIDLSEVRLSQMLGDIKRNSRNRRIAMFAPVVLAAAVLAAMIAAPPQHGGLLVADAETPDPQLPQVFGLNGVWRLAEPIEEAPADAPSPADMIEAPTEPTAPSFTLSPPDQEDLQSLPASTSTPPMSMSGQSLEAVEPLTVDNATLDPATLDWSAFGADIRIEQPQPTEADPADGTASDTTEPAAADAVVPAEQDLAPEETTTTPDISSTDLATPDESVDGDVTVAVEEPQAEQTQDHTEANPSTSTDDLTEADEQATSAPAVIIPQPVLVYSAHVTVTVQVVDDDSSVIDWCNTRVDWGDGSISRVAGSDEAALCTASCEYESTSSDASENADSDTINQMMQFEHDYLVTIDASPRVFVATGDGCSYNLAELQLSPFTVVPPR